MLLVTGCSGASTRFTKARWTRKSALLLAGATIAMISGEAVAQDAAPKEEAVAQGEAPAQAEAAASQEQAAAEATPKDGSTDIIVYARKRAENVQSVPIAISVLPKEIIDDGNLDELTDFVDLVPNATFSADAVTSSEISIRGSGRNMSEEDPSVGTYRDGVSLNDAISSGIRAADRVSTMLSKEPIAGGISAAELH